MFYPKWIPGTHEPTGPLTKMTGLKLTAAGKPLAWRRDALDMYAFHCEVPSGAQAVEVQFAYQVTNRDALEVSVGVVASPHLAILNWNAVLLYPQGKPAQEWTYVAQLRLPAGWKYGTALSVATATADTVTFQPVALTTLVDSPILTGAYFKTFPLMPAGVAIPHQLDLAADSVAALDLKPEFLAHLTGMVAESGALFGAHHYRDFHFLLALSDRIPPFGLEHQASSVNSAAERAPAGGEQHPWLVYLLPHEFLHSWCGKYRRPARMTTADYQQPLQTELLWVYEGLTHYLGFLVDVRSGLWTAEQFRENLAVIAADLEHRRGRTWRSLADAAIAVQLAPSPGSTERTSSDVYNESALIWLEIDVLLRKQSQGRRSLDDFCRGFFGGPGGRSHVRPYTFDDVVAALQDVVAHDWRTFLTTRLTSTEAGAPLGGIAGGGWRLVYTDKPNEFHPYARVRPTPDFRYSLGLRVSASGNILDVVPGMAADKAGLTTDMKLIGVNGRRWSLAELRAAVQASKTVPAPLELLVEQGEQIRTYRLGYHEGEKHPHLERAPDGPDLLEQLMKPRTTPAARATN